MIDRIKHIRLSISGVNINRLYQECKKRDIELHDINRIDYKNIEFDVDLKNKKNIEKIARNQNYKISQKKLYGFNKIFNFAGSRFGILIGIIIFAVLNVLSNFFVWDIKIYGNETVSAGEIMEVLSNENLKKGKFFGSINSSAIEESLMNNLDKISLCSVIKKGTTIIVNIKEKLLEKNAKNINGDGDIVASCNLTITELEVVSGTALKKVGDSVKAGDVIVAGYILDGSGEKVSCTANAKIKAKTWHSATEIYMKKAEIKTRTGNKIELSHLSLFGAKFPVKTAENTFKNFEEERFERVLTNNFLPIKMFTTIYYETTSELVEKNFENDREKVVARCKAEASKSIRDNEIISNAFDVVTEEKDRFVVTSYIEVLIEI